MDSKLQSFKLEIREEMQRILEWWRKYSPDERNGGFAGEIDQFNRQLPQADKGSVLHARILWTFSSAYRHSRQEVDLDLAFRAYEFIVQKFYDKTWSGVFWSVRADGTILSDRKQSYAIAFAIYGLAEFYKVTGDAGGLQLAVELYHALESRSLDPLEGGYFEAFTRDWQKLEEVRLSQKDRNDPKTMNTHLHLIEAYANLYRVWRDDRLEHSIRHLLKVFEQRIMDKTNHHLRLFFEADWKPTSERISYGHDIEASWLLHDAAKELQDPILDKRWSAIAIQIADASVGGLQADSSFIHEADPRSGYLDQHREWWVSAEGMVGYLNAWKLSGDRVYLERVYGLWNFIKKHLLDLDRGEWHWGVYPDYTRMPEYKMGFWKCPYHNFRACLEILDLLKE
ncbi:MAG TPA: AGE family epimerase/isomerase [Saprospiraceae bacterium]|nr:AGE family epimerase/isomerase [Saprospiraceae bacterium]HNT20517.1 AGE family epimerase/isomerase [Saprospiraceae bacterium]